MPSSTFDHNAYLGRRTFGSLDGIRALSVTAVVFHHTDHAGLPQSLLWERGFLGVDMFFVLSGFLIVTLLLREKDRHGAISLKKFYIRRSLRIFPVYYGLLILLSFVFLFTTQSSTGSVWFSELPVLASYTVNLFGVSTFMAVAWSLSAEEQFYLIWPAIERWSTATVLAVLAVALSISQAIHFRVFSYIGVPFEKNLPEFFLETTFTPILLGVALAHALHDRRWFDSIAGVLGPGWVSPALLASIVALTVFAPADITGWPRFTFHLLMTLFLASCVVREDHGTASILGMPLLARLGVVSYGIYLFHMLFRHGVRVGLDRFPTLDRPLVFFFLTLLCTWAFAELSFRTLETFFLRMKGKFSAL